MKLLIADDHTLFRDALVQYIERASPGSLIVLAKDFDEARESLAAHGDLDLVVLDFRMPGMKGFEGLKHVRKNYPHTPVAIMSGVAEQEDIRKALDMGARGYFPKTMSGKALVGAIQEVLAGGTFVPHDPDKKGYMPAYYNDAGNATVPLAGENRPAAAPQGKADKALIELGLTPRERQIVAFLTIGAANKDIAQALNLQVVTVKLHVRSICRKLGVKNRTQAALRLSEYAYLSGGSA